jgi:hypothetical protein
MALVPEFGHEGTCIAADPAKEIVSAAAAGV